jgi:hypothetical protein
MQQRSGGRILDHLAGPAFVEMMIVCGYYKSARTWRRRGVITLRGHQSIGGGRMNELFEREKARRFHESASAADQAVELAKFRDAAAVALDELVRLISPGDGRAQEAHARKVAKAAATLAGGVTEPATVECARLVAILKLECSHADALYFRMVREGQLGSRASREVSLWRDRSGRRLESMMRTFAYMRHCAMSDIQASLSRLKLVAG